MIFHGLSLKNKSCERFTIVQKVRLKININYQKSLHAILFFAGFKNLIGNSTSN